MPEPRMTPAAERLFLGEIDAGVFHGIDAGDHGELREAIDPLGVFGGDVIAGRPIVDIAAELDFVLGGVEQADRVDAALALENAVPQIVDSAAQRGDRSQSGDDDAPFHWPLRLRALDVLDGLTDRLDFFRRIVRNVDVELFFEFHHQFDGIERVSPRSFTNDVSVVILSLSTPNCSATISITRSLTDATLMVLQNFNTQEPREPRQVPRSNMLTE